jgi:hypothetical protein
MSDTVERSWTTSPLDELRANLNLARGLVAGGRALETLDIGKFEISDMYRAAWVQAVSALDQWAFREIYERALGLALDAAADRPPKFLKLQVPMGMFEDLYHRSGDIEKTFSDYLREHLRFQTFQQPDKIKEGFCLVSRKSLWPCVADELAQADGKPTSASAVVECLRDIVNRRNNIAHAADRDPVDGTAKNPISANEVDAAIDHIDRIARAVVDVLGPAPRGPQVEPMSDHPSKQELYLQYWTEFKPVVERRGWTKAQPQPQNWWNMPGGITNTTWALSFSRFGCRSELYFEDPDSATNLRRWRILNARRTDIEARFGDGLIFDELPRNKGCRIETRLHGVTVDQRDRWPQIQRWMEDTQVRLRAAVLAVGGVPS